MAAFFINIELSINSTNKNKYQYLYHVKTHSLINADTNTLLLQTPYEKRLAIIAETFKQLQKDIGIDDDVLIFEGNPESAYQQLFECIEPYLHNLLQSNAQRFARVLYKVDISEGALNKKLMAFPEKSYVRIVTEMVIYRAFQKVMTKMISRENLK